jgi:hypothetical protein
MGSSSCKLKPTEAKASKLEDNMGGRGKEAAFVGRIQAKLYAGSKGHLERLKNDLRDEQGPHVTLLEFMQAGATHSDVAWFGSIARRRSEQDMADSDLWTGDMFRAEKILRGESSKSVFATQLKAVNAADREKLTPKGFE